MFFPPLLLWIWSLKVTLEQAGDSWCTAIAHQGNGLGSSGEGVSERLKRGGIGGIASTSSLLNYGIEYITQEIRFFL